MWQGLQKVYVIFGGIFPEPQLGISPFVGAACVGLLTNSSVCFAGAIVESYIYGSLQGHAYDAGTRESSYPYEYFNAQMTNGSNTDLNITRAETSLVDRSGGANTLFVQAESAGIVEAGHVRITGASSTNALYSSELSGSWMETVSEAYSSTSARWFDSFSVNVDGLDQYTPLNVSGSVLVNSERSPTQVISMDNLYLRSAVSEVYASFSLQTLDPLTSVIGYEHQGVHLGEGGDQRVMLFDCLTFNDADIAVNLLANVYTQVLATPTVGMESITTSAWEDFGHSLTWGGIDRVMVGDTLISDFTTNSVSGFDYRYSAAGAPPPSVSVPGPTSFTLLWMAMTGLLCARRRKTQFHTQ